MSRRIKTKASLPELAHIALLTAAAGACAVLFAVAQPAAAQDASAGGEGGFPSSKTVRVEVKATVGSACGFADGGAPNGSHDIGEVGDVWHWDFPFTLECTGPVRMAVVSDSGYLTAPLPVGGLPSGYTNQAPYQVNLHMEGDAGVTPADATCDTQNLVSGGSCSFTGPSSTTQGLLLNGPAWDKDGYLRVQTTAPYAGSAILMASDPHAYTDTLHVTITPVT